MEFEFDAEKSKANKAKHAIDFTEAAMLWNDERRIEVPARTVGEARVMVIGVINGQCWSVVVTQRKDKIRIISGRRSRDEEVELYEGQDR